MGRAAGWQKHLWFKKETTWGTAVVPDVWIPHEGFDLKTATEFYRGSSFTGIRQKIQPNQPMRKTLGGTLSLDWYGYQVTSGTLKSVAQHLMDAALSAPAGLDLDSFTFCLYDPNDTKRYKGARINSLTVSGSAGGPIKMSLALVGKEEDTTTAPTLVATVPHYKAAMFHDCTLTVGGVLQDEFTFSVTINNNLISKNNKSLWPTTLMAGEREVTYQFGIDKTAGTYDALARSLVVNESAAVLVIKGDHQGTATNTYTTATLNFDLSNFNGVSDTAGLNEVWNQNLDYLVLKPPTTDDDLNITWGTAA